MFPATCTFQPAAEWHLSIRGPQRLLDRLSVNDGRIAMKHGYHHHTGRLDIELSGPTLRDITLNGAGKLVLDHLQQDSLAVAIHGSGSVRASWQRRVAQAGHHGLG